MTRREVAAARSPVAGLGRYIVIWGEDSAALPAPAEITLLERAAGGHGGRLLAFGPAHEAVERDSRSVPAWVAIAGFTGQDELAAWFEPVKDRWTATALVVPAHTEPVWWPPERQRERPSWSASLQPPAERLGVFISVWVDITDLETFRDYAARFRWTVEHNGGASLGSAPAPAVLAGGPGPMATPLLAMRSQDSLKAWYGGADYRPYRDQRHASANCTTVSVSALHQPHHTVA